MALYLERGYDAVTVAQIAESAGLTKRTFFRYFTDKREVLFAGARAFQTAVTDAVESAPDAAAPIDAVIAALASSSGEQLAQYGQFARRRRNLIASTADLQERELIKMASLTAAVAAALRRRGVPALRASLTSQAAMAAFTTAYDHWVDQDGATDLPTLIQQSLNDLRRAICADEPAGDEPAVTGLRGSVT